MNEASTCNALNADGDLEAVPNHALFWTACFLVTLSCEGVEEGEWCAPLWREKGVVRGR